MLNRRLRTSSPSQQRLRTSSPSQQLGSPRLQNLQPLAGEEHAYFGPSLLVFSIADRARLIRTRYFSQPAFRRLPRLRSGQAQAAISPSTGSGHAFDYASKGGKNAPAQAPREARPWSTQSSGLFPMISDLRTPPPAVPPRATPPQPPFDRLRTGSCHTPHPNPHAATPHPRKGPLPLGRSLSTL